MLLALAGLIGWASQATNANHGQTATFPEVDYVALDAVNEGGNTQSTLEVGEPPWDDCVFTIPGSTVYIDVVVDRVPVIPDINNSPSFRHGVTALQLVLRYDNTRLIRGNPDPAQSLLSAKPGSSVVVTYKQLAFGPPRVDLISILDFDSTAGSQEDDMQGVGMRIPFTAKIGASGVAQVDLLGSAPPPSDPLLTKVFAGTGLEVVELTISNMFGGPREGDANDLRTVKISIGQSFDDPDGDCDGVPNSVDNCPVLANPWQDNTDADVLAAGGWKQNLVDMTGDSLGDACDPDDDNDFFSDVEEQRIYTSPGFAAEQLVPCLSPGNPDPWPLDVFPAGSPDQGIDTGDVLYELGFVGLFTASPGFDPRLDISLPAGGIDTTEVLFILGFVGFFCAPP